jgi:prolyl oligopeptidase
MKYSSTILLPILLLSCASAQKVADDKYLWLEDVLGKNSLEWVEKQNSVSKNLFESDPRFKDTHQELERLALAKDRIPDPELNGDNVENIWQDDKNVRGIWRTTTLESYKTAHPKWQTILDFDKLGKDEGKSWVYKGGTCLEPERRHCLINLSEGGSDAVVVREFDKKSRQFVTKEPFNLPTAKSNVSWVDENTVLVATDFGPNTLTDSGYPRILKMWKRGTALSSARTLLLAGQKDVEIASLTVKRDGKQYAFGSIGQDFFHSENYILDLSKPSAEKINLPSHVQFLGILNDYFIFKNREPMSEDGKTIPAGSVISRKLRDQHTHLNVIYTPASDEALNDTFVNKKYIVISILKNVLGQIQLLTLDNQGKLKNSYRLDLPKDGNVWLSSAEKTSTRMIATYTNYLTPIQYYLVEDKRLKKIKAEPARFDSSKYEVNQKWAVSSDGTKIPYSVIHKKGIELNGQNPTLLYGYGGFEYSTNPRYLYSYGKVWLDKGGVYVEANLRGGGEFGPKWHQAAIKENKQKVFEDFYAVSRALIEEKITSPSRLGIIGGSNGGLLVGAALTQHPELYNAVVCEVPLLDMLRYHTLLAGASWMAEYGNPDIAQERAYIQKYSPYQNVRADVKYPQAYFFTTTRDDRVHPAHARKMVARMHELGHNVLYFENTEGGHGGGADPKQKALTDAYQWMYLYKKLID